MNRLRKDLIYGMDKNSINMAKQREILAKKLIEQKRLMAQKAAKIGLGHPVNRPANAKPQSRGCGCSKHK